MPLPSAAGALALGVVALGVVVPGAAFCSGAVPGVVCPVVPGLEEDAPGVGDGVAGDCGAVPGVSGFVFGVWGAVLGVVLCELLGVEVSEFVPDGLHSVV
jgi:hypothetical protein